MSATTTLDVRFEPDDDPSAHGAPVLVWRRREGWVLHYLHRGEPGRAVEYEVVGGPDDVAGALRQAVQHLRSRADADADAVAS